MIRKLFVDEVQHESDLGLFRSGIRWTQSNLLWAQIDGKPEAILEQWGGIGPLTGGVQYLHLPSNGLVNVGRVARALASGAPSPPPSNQWVPLLVTLTGLPLFLGVMGSALFIAWSQGLRPTNGFDVVLGLFGALWLGLVLVSLVRYVLMFAFTKVLDTTYAAEVTRFLFGRPGSEFDAGTYQGPGGKNSALVKALVLHSRLSVMPTYGKRRWLVLTRSAVTPLSARVSLFRLEEWQMPALIDALSRVDSAGAPPAG